MPNTATARAQERDLRCQIVDTALQLFSRNGYFNTSVHDIRRAAGVSIGAIYHHFPSKEAIASALYDELVDRMDQVMVDIVAAHGSAHDRCRAVVAALYELAETQREMMSFILNAKHREFMPDATPICSSRPFGRMLDMVREGIAAGEIRQMEALVAAPSLFGGPLRLLQLRLDGVLTVPLPSVLDTAWECAWRAVANP